MLHCVATCICSGEKQWRVCLLQFTMQHLFKFVVKWKTKTVHLPFYWKTLVNLTRVYLFCSFFHLFLFVFLSLKHKEFLRIYWTFTWLFFVFPLLIFFLPFYHSSTLLRAYTTNTNTAEIYSETCFNTVEM